MFSSLAPTACGPWPCSCPGPGPGPYAHAPTSAPVCRLRKWTLPTNISFFAWAMPQTLDNAALRFLLGRHAHCKWVDAARAQGVDPGRRLTLRRPLTTRWTPVHSLPPPRRDLDLTQGSSLTQVDFGAGLARLMALDHVLLLSEVKCTP